MRKFNLSHEVMELQAMACETCFVYMYVGILRCVKYSKKTDV